MLTHTHPNRYMPAGKISKPADGKTSLSEGGACHMGRAARMPARKSGTATMNTKLCRKIHTNYTHIVARCFDSSGSTSYSDYEMQRELSAAPDWMAEHMKQERVRCNAGECNAASSASSSSSWKTESDARDLPHGAEASYGIPFRWSASRLLASDMRSVLCSALNSTNYTKRSYHNDSAKCDALLNLPAWTIDGFMQRYADSTFASLLQTSLQNLVAPGDYEVPPSLLDMHKHMQGGGQVVDGTYATSLKNIMQKPDVDGSLLWDGPDAPAWVACAQKNKTCYGKISKQEWYSPASKPEACIRVFDEQVRAGLVNSTAVGLDVCNLNSKTNELCQVFFMCSSLHI